MTENPDVILVNMPFALLQHPPLGLGLLKGALIARGIRTRVLNLNLRFGALIGETLYARVAMSDPTMLCGEWLWSEALWGPDADSDRAYLREVLGVESPLPTSPLLAQARKHSLSGLDAHELAGTFLDVRTRVQPFLEDCLRDYPWGSCRVVGFTSVFEQHVAALALARRLKEQYPHLFIVMGGANCEDDMGRATFEAFGFLDAVCSGEGDHAFPSLVESVLGEGPAPAIAGIHRRSSARDAKSRPKRSLVAAGAAAKPAATTASIHDLDALPYPDFDDYFEDVGAIDVTPQLVFETSRGCWWGAKQHCTFCGLNGANMAFRAKSAPRALSELLYLLDRYGMRTRTVNAADNIIPLPYFKELLPKLRDMQLDINLFYETKANLKKEQVKLYREAGLASIQPGIESLSTPVLRLMRKGITQLQNIQLLKWCRQYGVQPSWNYIIGFPGELPEYYDGQDDLVRSIAHLAPPSAWGHVRFDRFSPYFTAPAEFGLRNLRPYRAYGHVYRGLAESQLRDMAYYFEADYDNRDRAWQYAAPLIEALNDWMAHEDQYALFTLESGPRLHVFDLRPAATVFSRTLEATQRAVYDACDSIAQRSQIASRLEQAGQTATDAAITDALKDLCRWRLLACEGDHYLALGVPLGDRYVPSGAAHSRFLEALPQL